jgi:hypothetical protein
MAQHCRPAVTMRRAQATADQRRIAGSEWAPGVAISDAENITLQDSTVGPVAWWSVDTETDDDCMIARHINITRNQFGASRYGAIGSVGFGGDPQVGDVSVTDNTQTVSAGLPGECWAPVWILSPDAMYRTGYTFRGNRFLARRNAFEFRRIRDIDVSSNSVTLTPTTGCGTRAGVLLVDHTALGSGPTPLAARTRSSRPTR